VPFTERNVQKGYSASQNLRFYSERQQRKDIVGKKILYDFEDP
jgi:hypothetical protein